MTGEDAFEIRGKMKKDYTCRYNVHVRRINLIKLDLYRARRHEIILF